MGIRFACPNGHKLHVKSFLAGKRGICPDCGAKFVIPSPVQTQTVEGAGKPATNGAAAPRPASRCVAVGPIVAQTEAASLHTNGQPASAPAASDESLVIATVPATAPPAPATLVAAQPSAIWYVRPSSGGQFGPASEQAMSDWIAAGRVERDTYVWQSNWPDWRLAGDVADQLPAPLSVQMAAAPAAEVAVQPAPQPVVEQPPAELLEKLSPQRADSHYLVRRRRSERAQRIVALLLLVTVIVLGALLAVVLSRGPRQTSAAGDRHAIELSQVTSQPCVGGWKSAWPV